MPGQATVTIKETQWSVSIASTYAELSKGLGGVASIPAATGMLFVLPAEQTVSVTTQPMLFNLDIIFISSDLKVVDIARDVAPGYIITESTPVKYFLEINAGEAVEVEAGDSVEIEQLATIQDNITPVIAFAIPLVALGFVSTMVAGMARVMIGSSYSAHHSPELRAPYVSASEHHSMWLTLDQRKELEKKYGAVAVRWAEEATRPGDTKAAERAAEYYYNRVKEVLGLGHLSPELTGEQIIKLRETLGLPAEVPPRERGYVD